MRSNTDTEMIYKIFIIDSNKYLNSVIIIKNNGSSSSDQSQPSPVWPFDFLVPIDFYKLFGWPMFWFL